MNDIYDHIANHYKTFFDLFFSRSVFFARPFRHCPEYRYTDRILNTHGI
jgi:hypothetical protein